MITFIYALIDPRTEAVRYIGKTVNPKQRYQAHRTRRINTHCSAWIASLAEAGYLPVMRILEALPNSTGIDAERRWIADGIELGWNLTNLTPGGETPEMTPELRQHLSEKFRGRAISQTTRDKISKALMGRKQPGKKQSFRTDEHRANVSKALKGRPGKKQSPETLAKLSAIRKGRTLTSEHKEKIAEGLKLAYATNPRPENKNKGGTISDEQKAAISATLMGHPVSEETRQRMSEARKGKPGHPHTDEAKAKISAGHKARKMKKEADDSA